MIRIPIPVSVLLVLVALTLVCNAGGCKKPYTYGVQIINATYGDLRSVKLDWGKGKHAIGGITSGKEQVLGPWFSRPPDTVTLTWMDEGREMAASAEVPVAAAGFDGTYFILVKDDAISVHMANLGDRQTYERLREQVPGPPPL